MAISAGAELGFWGFLSGFLLGFRKWFYKGSVEGLLEFRKGSF